MIPTAPALPVIKATLKNGRSLKIRAYHSHDKEKLKSFLLRLSGRTKYLRFGYEKSCFTEKEIDQFAGINYPADYALVALRGEGEAERIVAVGTWSLIPGRSEAEVGFVVEDAIQLRGVGTELLRLLAEEATRVGIKSFLAYVLPENSRMLDVFENSGFPITKRLAEGTYEIKIAIDDREKFLVCEAKRHQIACSALIRKFIAPHSIAVVGDFENPQSVGARILHNLVAEAFTGQIFTVNTQSSGEMPGCPGFDQLPDMVDLVISTVPLPDVPAVINEGVSRGTSTFIVISEEHTDGNNGRWPGIIAEKALAYGVRLLGPHSGGVINANPSYRLNATAYPFRPPAGRLGVAADNRQLSLNLLHYLCREMLGVANFLCLGAQRDVSVWDLLEFWEADENTAVILLGLATLDDPSGFLRAARKITSKPIILVEPEKSVAQQDIKNKLEEALRN